MGRAWLSMVAFGLLAAPAFAQDEDPTGDEAAAETSSMEETDDATEVSDDVDEMSDDDADEDEMSDEDEADDVDEMSDDAETMDDDWDEEEDEVDEADATEDAPDETPVGDEPKLHDFEAPVGDGTAREVIYDDARAANVTERHADAGEMAPIDVAVKKRSLPKYPSELVTLYGEQAIRCEADVQIDGKGKPLWVAVTDCPDGFHLAVAEAMATWRWEEPPGSVGSGGVRVRAKTGFERANKTTFPGVTYFRTPEEVTADTTLPVLIRKGKMPKYPRQVHAGDDICLMELTIDAKGNTRDVIIDECATPYRKQLAKVVKSWKWWWTTEPEKKETHTLVTEMVFRI